MSKVISARNFTLEPTDNDAFSFINKLIYPTAVRDRFGILNRLSPINWSEKTDEIPTAFAETVALGTIIDRRMAEILAMCPSGRIVVAWSGGVDSTALICAYLRSGADIKRLTVIGTEDSIEEYPFFFEMMKKEGIEISIVSSLTSALASVDCELILTGWCADQLFGSDVNTQNHRLYNQPWVDSLRTFALQNKGIRLSNNSLEIIESVYTDYANKLGFPVEQWCEFLWMMNFGCKWTYVQHETNLSLMGSSNYGKAVNFYESLDFQRWSVSRFPKLRERNPHVNNLFYKKPLKQYILNHTGDQSYYKTKGKMATRSYYAEDKQFIAVLTDDGARYFRLAEGQKNHMSLSHYVAQKFRKIG